MPKRWGDGALSLVRLWSLREDALLEMDRDLGTAVVVSERGETQLDDVGGVVGESLHRMALGPIAPGNVLPPRHRDGGGEWERFGAALDRLGGVVVHSLAGNDSRLLLSAVPVEADAAFELPLLQPRDEVRLSRYAALRAGDGEMLLESPLAPYQVRLHRHLAVKVVAGLGSAVAVVDLAAALRVARPVVTDLVAYLVASGAVLRGRADPGGVTRFAEDTDPVLARWTRHDLLFHVSTRRGRGDGPAGAVYPLAGCTPPPPALRPRPGPAVPLHRPDRPDGGGPPLFAAVEAVGRPAGERRGPVAAAPTARLLGELLFRTARVRSVGETSGFGSPPHEVSDRPHVDRLGLHELEVYACVDRCAGLDRGAYHYDPAAHALVRVADPDEWFDELLDEVRAAVSAADRPPVLLVITVRTERASWVYRDIGYATALAHTGALQQLLHLVAGALGLEPLVPPLEPGEVADRALGLDWLVETAVGGCALGYAERRGEEVPAGQVPFDAP
ncbi:SagB family peptide dehydrogenase [Saccharothrix lopnurensis]|uniref:SagB family peptide dehydrogenase n=1 Tax=Saccharothrix lopnurensis TaxID=1670621 RepID=A0ABW1PGN2_9PSEU